jgi:peptidoglycan/xylan/chitin deacetylase (PgdA/CDA1 family)
MNVETGSQLTKGFVQTYQELKAAKPDAARDKARKLVLNLSASLFVRPALLRERFRKPRVQFLYIHHVFRDEESKLERLLEALSQEHQFISYTEAWKRVLENKIDRPYIAFSSDDGLKNNLAAARILQQFGASACFFICPGIVGETDFEKLSAFAAEKLHFPPVEFLNWNDVHDLQKSGHEIGSHTMNHINVQAGSPDIVSREIADSMRVLHEYCGETIHFAYPYGRHCHFSAFGRQQVFEAGYQSCASAERGCHITDPTQLINKDKLLIRRDHIILNWPLEHILFFLARNSKIADPSNNFFPQYADSHSDQ